MQQATFEQWLKNNPDIDPDETVVCVDCGGEGLDFCPECDNEILCPSCEGRGKISVAREEYEDRLISDKLLLQNVVT